MLGLHCSEGFCLVAVSGACALVAVCRLLFVVTPPLVVPGCRAQARYLWCMGPVALCMWGLTRSGIEPMPPALAGRFFFLSLSHQGSPIPLFYEKSTFKKTRAQSQVLGLRHCYTPAFYTVLGMKVFNKSVAVNK